MMASSGLSFTFSLLFFIISSPSSSISLPSVSSSSKKVSLGLYYETLCPFSAKFIINDFAKIFHNGLIDIVDLNLVPWGNAKLGKNNTFNCQHDYGQWETCFEKLNLDHKPVTNCYGSGLGDKDYTDFISYICKAYKGNTLPKACSESSVRTSTEEEKVNGNNPVCYKKSRQHYQD